VIDDFQNIEQLMDLQYLQEMNHKHETVSDLPKLKSNQDVNHLMQTQQ
jgi:hypothetical protein